MRNDNDIILAALKQDGTAFKHLDRDKKENKEYIDIAIKSNPFSICYVNEIFITIDQVKYCLSLEPSLINQISANFKQNPEIIKSVDKVDSKVHLNPDDESLLYEVYGQYNDYFMDEDYDPFTSISSYDLPF